MRKRPEFPPHQPKNIQQKKCDKTTEPEVIERCSQGSHQEKSLERVRNKEIKKKEEDAHDRCRYSDTAGRMLLLEENGIQLDTSTNNQHGLYLRPSKNDEFCLNSRFPSTSAQSKEDCAKTDLAGKFSKSESETNTGGSILRRLSDGRIERLNRGETK